jgi:hypothetical protein
VSPRLLVSVFGCPINVVRDHPRLNYLFPAYCRLPTAYFPQPRGVAVGKLCPRHKLIGKRLLRRCWKMRAPVGSDMSLEGEALPLFDQLTLPASRRAIPIAGDREVTAVAERENYVGEAGSVGVG